MTPRTRSDFSFETHDFKTWEEVFEQSQKIPVKELRGARLRSRRTLLLNRRNPNIQGLKDKDGDALFSIFFYWIRHPKEGDILVDLGLGKGFMGRMFGPFSFLSPLLARPLNIELFLEEKEDISSHMVENRLRPRKVFLTHLSPDRLSSVPLLPGDVEYHLGKKDYSSLILRIGCIWNLGKVPSLKLLDFRHASGIPPFEKVIDLFGDASVFALWTPGHTPGHTSFLVNASEGPVLLAGEACMDDEAFEHDIEPVLFDTLENARKSLRAIKKFTEMYPRTKLFLSHNLA